MRSVSVLGIGNESDFFRRQNNRNLTREKRINSVKIRAVHMVITCLVLFCAGYGTYLFADFVLKWEKLDLKFYSISSAPQFAKSEMKGILNKYRGNILTVDLKKVREDLLTIPEVRDVSLSRQLPDTLKIKFLLRKPLFQFKFEGKYNIIDKEAVILSSSKEMFEDLIEIRHVSNAQLEEISPYLQEISELGKKNVSYISLQKPYGLKLKIKGVDEIFYPGETEFKKKIMCFLKIKKKMDLESGKIKYVDLRFKNRIYFELQEEVLN